MGSELQNRSRAAALLVDLGQRTSDVVELPGSVVDAFLGGRGLGSYLLANHLAADTTPLSPANPLIFAIGPLQGTHAPFSSKVILTTKSPLTGIYCFTVASSDLGSQLARCGFLALIITGCASRPSYLWIDEGQVDLRPADDFWEAPTSSAMARISAETSCPDTAVCVIGPAGSRMVPYASVLTGGQRMRAFGRGGAGAVMGSKLLKGIAVRGQARVLVSHAADFRGSRQAVNKAVSVRGIWAERRRVEGTTTSMPILQEHGLLPTRNWQEHRFEGLERLMPAAHQEEEDWVGESVPCASTCPATCARRYQVVRGEYSGWVSEGPDYETIYAFGSNCGIDRFDAIVAADKLCDELGLDTISTGVTISFAMECAEHGLLPAELAGEAPRFADHQSLLALVPRIAAREGLGALLAKGTRRAAEIIGQDSETFAMHAKGLELGGWGCRASYAQAIQYALGSRGGCHHDLGCPAKVDYVMPEAVRVRGKGALVLRTGAERIVFDSAVACSFAGQYLDLETLAKMLAAVRGQPYDTTRLIEIGERVLTLERLLNVREGIGRPADQLPERLLRGSLHDGPRQGPAIPLEALKTDFYTAAGWNVATGVPSQATLARLDLSVQVPHLAVLAGDLAPA